MRIILLLLLVSAINKPTITVTKTPAIKPPEKPMRTGEIFSSATGELEDSESKSVAVNSSSELFFHSDNSSLSSSDPDASTKESIDARNVEPFENAVPTALTTVFTTNSGVIQRCFKLLNTC